MRYIDDIINLSQYITVYRSSMTDIRTNDAAKVKNRKMKSNKIMSLVRDKNPRNPNINVIVFNVEMLNQR